MDGQGAEYWGRKPKVSALANQPMANGGRRGANRLADGDGPFWIRCQPPADEEGIDATNEATRGRIASTICRKSPSASRPIRTRLDEVSLTY